MTRFVTFCPRQILEERARLTSLGEMEIQMVGDRFFAVSPTGWDESVEVDPEELDQYDINIRALANYLREDLGLGGPAIEQATMFLTWLGATRSGSRREGFYLARRMTPERAMEFLSITRGHDPAPRITLLTPTVRNLPAAVSRQFEATGARVIALEEIISGDFALPLPPIGANSPVDPRLVVDVSGHLATFDGRSLNLPRREFAVLVTLTGEAATEGGIVSRGSLLDAIATATRHDNRHDDQLSAAISDLRRALGAKELFATTKGVGYRLKLEPDDIRLT